MNDSQLLTIATRHREHLHAHPELGHMEFETQKYICEQLERLGLTYKKFNTSTICDLIVDENYPIIAMRADIDALAITEGNEVHYKSKNIGCMHACGHDGHTAIQLAVIEYFVNNEAKLKCNIRFIFQCDEESDGGAEELCDAGFLNGIESVYGLHLDNDYPVGTIAYKHDQMNAGGDEVDITVTGKQAHGAYPHQGVDSILCSANIIQSTQQIVSRQVGPLDSTVITIGTINGPGTPNTICGEVTMRGTIRNLNADTRKRTVEQFIKQTKLIGDAHNCRVEVVHTPSYPPLVNNNDLVDYVIANSKELGYDVQDKKNPSLGLEDFGYYSSIVPGVFFNVGSCIEGDYRNAHSSTFDFEPKALLVGVKVQIANALNFKETDEC